MSTPTSPQGPDPMDDPTTPEATPVNDIDPLSQPDGGTVGETVSEPTSVLGTDQGEPWEHREPEDTPGPPILPSTTGEPVGATGPWVAQAPVAQASQVQAPEQKAPGGPHLPAILLGLACLLVAVVAIAQEVGSLTIDWGNVGPLGIVAAGALLVVLGLIGLMASRKS